MFKRKYTFQKSHSILKWAFSWFEANKDSLPNNEKEHLDKKMEALQDAINTKDRKEADRLARELEQLGKGRFKKPFWKAITEFTFALAIALVLATIIRQSWFELYEIPTGSMRPTYKEQDRLLVSKTTHGLNIPLVTDHFTFLPEQVKRGNIVIWSGDGIDLPDVNSKYFGVLPYTKRFIKRLIGKPGDTLYFYGGHVYGVDKDGNEITELSDTSWIKDLEYIPFISFDGKPEVKNKELVYKHFNQPLGRVELSLFGPENGTVWNGEKWTNESQELNFAKMYGIENFAMVNLNGSDLSFHYNPSLKNTASSLRARKEPLQTSEAVLPLNSQELEKLQSILYTSRFVVKNGTAYSYSGGESLGGIALPGVPDGTYEFDKGVGYKIHLTGVATKLSKEHPLYSKDPKQIAKLFNYGVRFRPMRGTLQPRFAYFRDGDLYIMGQKFLSKGDPKLSRLQDFKDLGAPSKEKIEKYGLKIPKGMYLVLGDNHADSGDSRYFGFVPEENIQGSPIYTFWPPGKGFGIANEHPVNKITMPQIISWVAFLIGLSIWLWYRKWQLKRPIYHK